MEPFIFLIKLQAQTIASAFAVQLAMALYCPLEGMGEGPQKPGFISNLNICDCFHWESVGQVPATRQYDTALMIYRNQRKCKV